MKHYIGICLVLCTLGAICFFVVRSCTSAVDETVDRVTSAFADVLQVRPQVSVNQRVIMTQTAPIAELAVVTKEEGVSIALNEHLEVLKMQIPLTEKKLTAEAVFRLKAGFDLSEPFSVEIDPKTHVLQASMPRAKILSIERVGDVSYHGDDAMLNRITDADRMEVLADLDTAARDAAENSTLRKEAEDQVAQRLSELMDHNGQLFTIKWAETPGKSLPTQ